MITCITAVTLHMALGFGFPSHWKTFEGSLRLPRVVPAQEAFVALETRGG